MENLELRKSVAEALGCKAVIRTINDLAGTDNTYLFCECERAERFNSHSEWVSGKLLVLPYELDDAAALAALREFCERNQFEADLRIVPGGRQNCIIFGREPRPPGDPIAILLADIFNDTLALAICEAIRAAAEGR